MLVSPAVADVWSPGNSFTWTPVTGTTYNFTSDGSVTLTQPSGGQDNGPFVVAINSADATLAKVGNGTEVFCLENNVYFTPGARYVATLNDLVYSGQGPAGTYSKALSEDAKKIYNAFREGTLTNWAAIGNGIWYAQGIGGAYLNPGPSDYVSGDFKVLNLWTLTGSDASGWTATDVQSQIVKIPAPAAAVLGMMGLGLVGWVRKRMS
jgi:hypothetical protein